MYFSITCRVVSVEKNIGICDRHFDLHFLVLLSSIVVFTHGARFEVDRWICLDRMSGCPFFFFGAGGCICFDCIVLSVGRRGCGADLQVKVAYLLKGSGCKTTQGSIEILSLSPCCIFTSIRKSTSSRISFSLSHCFFFPVWHILLGRGKITRRSRELRDERIGPDFRDRANCKWAIFISGTSCAG